MVGGFNSWRGSTTSTSEVKEPYTSMFAKAGGKVHTSGYKSSGYTATK